MKKEMIVDNAKFLSFIFETMIFSLVFQKLEILSYSISYFILFFILVINKKIESGYFLTLMYFSLVQTFSIFELSCDLFKHKSQIYKC